MGGLKCHLCALLHLAMLLHILGPLLLLIEFPQNIAGILKFFYWLGVWMQKTPSSSWHMQWGPSVEWHWFMALLWKAILQIVGPKFVFIYDREKGLLPTYNLA